MDWDAAIDRNRTALKRVLATLVAMAGLDEDPDFRARETDDAISPQDTAGPHPEVPPKAASKELHPEVRSEAEPRRTLPRRLHLAVLRLLRPAEAAVRRLIVIVARGMVVELPPQRPPRPKPKSIYVRDGAGTGIVLTRAMREKLRRPPPTSISLPVADAPYRFRRRRYVPQKVVPRLWIPGGPDPVPLPKPPAPDDEIDASRVALRIRALAKALDDLPGHAKRFARWQARSKARRIRRLSPLKPGHPPGLSIANQKRPKHEIHHTLWDLHGLAYGLLEAPDTS